MPCSNALQVINPSRPALCSRHLLRKSRKFFWFISKNKEEPRLADRYIEEGHELEQPLAIARDVKKLYERIPT